VFSGRARLPTLDDTIVALGSAAAPGARAVIRLSGKKAVAITSAVCPDFERDPCAGRQWQAAALRLDALASPLPADVVFWPGPQTFTGQDVVEIHTISSPPLVDLTIARFLDAGARAAQPGEFTMRAFLAGKLDLTRAEAVRGVIEARDRGELREALAQLAGGVAQPLHELREDLLDLLADVEAALDFADEDLRFVDRDQLLLRITKGLACITLVRKQMEQRALGQRPFRAALAGKPNAGKSSLFNALVGKPAALVSAEAATTRDYLEANVKIEGVAIQLVDSAGWRDPGDDIDAQAQELGRREVHRADLVLWCHEPDDADEDISASTLPMLALSTKCDLGRAAPGLHAVSVVSGAGLAELRTELARRARQHGGSPLAPSVARCRHHVDACLTRLRHAHGLALEEEPPELLALELRLALEELGAMVGAVYSDDLLDRIFSRFCVGK
jgi:tRNA modification GTPase